MKMFRFFRSLEKNIQFLTSSVTPFGVPPSPKGKAYPPDKREFEHLYKVTIRAVVQSNDTRQTISPEIVSGYQPPDKRVFDHIADVSNPLTKKFPGLC